MVILVLSNRKQSVQTEEDWVLLPRGMGFINRLVVAVAFVNKEDHMTQSYR